MQVDQQVATPVHVGKKLHVLVHVGEPLQVSVCVHVTPPSLIVGNGWVSSPVSSPVSPPPSSCDMPVGGASESVCAEPGRRVPSCTGVMRSSSRPSSLALAEPSAFSKNGFVAGRVAPGVLAFAAPGSASADVVNIDADATSAPIKYRSVMICSKNL